jgi:hypothetical protein
LEHESERWEYMQKVRRQKSDREDARKAAQEDKERVKEWDEGLQAYMAGKGKKSGGA